jgi:hypothetical protein
MDFDDNILKELKDSIYTCCNPHNKNSFNDPMDFNAFYMQYSCVFYDKIQQIKSIDEFSKMFGKGPSEFMDIFWKEVRVENNEMYLNLNKKYKFKWNKRIYQLYGELKNNYLNKQNNVVNL